MIWHNEKRKLSELIEYDHNPRILTNDQYKQLKDSLTKFNLAEIPAINQNNNLLAGHQRLRILMELHGPEYEIDVRVPDRLLTEEEEKEYLIRSNLNTGEWDWDELANNFDVDSLLEWGFTDTELGIDDKTIQEKENQENKPPEYEFSKELMEENNYIIFTFNNQLQWNVIKEAFDIKTVKTTDSKPNYMRCGIGRVLDGQVLIDKIQGDLSNVAEV